jgi:hypothetical protein
MLLRHASSVKDTTLVAGGNEGQLDFVVSFGSPKLMRAAPIQVGSLVETLAPAVDLSSLLTTEATTPGGLGDVIWTGKTSGLAVRTLGSPDAAKVVRIDCAP